MAAAEGNKYAQKYTEEEALIIFMDALEYARTNKDCLCMQDIVIHSGMASRTFYDLADKYKVLQDIKRDMNDAVISRINKGSLKGDLVPSCSIWRMKQLGEKDQQYNDNTHSGSINISPKEWQK